MTEKWSEDPCRQVRENLARIEENILSAAIASGRKRADIGIHRDIGQPGLVKDGAGSAVSCVDVDACRGKLAHEEHGTGCGCEHTLKK